MAPFPSRRESTSIAIDINQSTDTLESYPPSSPILNSNSILPTSFKRRSSTLRTLPRLRSTDPNLLYGQMELPTGGILGGLGRSRATQELVRDLLQENHIKNHTFTNDRGFHNHIAHSLLSAFSLGAGTTLIQDIYDLENFDVKPMPPLQPIEITELNWLEYLGEERLYPNFLMFFNSLISVIPSSTSQYAGRKSSAIPVLEKYLLGGEGEMLFRGFGGALHPIILIGHAIEFNLDRLLAEGLAQAAVHSPTVSPLFPDSFPPAPRNPTSFQSTLTNTLSAFKLGYKSLSSFPIASPLDSFARTATSLPRTRSERDKKSREGLSGFTILERIMNDPELAAGEACDIDDTPLLEATLKRKGDKIRIWCEEWKFSGDKSVDYEDEPRRGSTSSDSSSNGSSRMRVPEWEEIVEKCEELIWMATVIYSATTRPGYVNVKLDFFLMHALTSSLFLPTILEQISPHLRPYILHAHFRVMLGYYVSRGRPKIHLPEILLSATAFPTPPNSNPSTTISSVAQVLASRPNITTNESIQEEEEATTPHADSMNGKLKSPLLDFEDSISSTEEVKVEDVMNEEVVDEVVEEEVKKEEEARESGINPWPAIIASCIDHPDGHVPKVIRSLAYAATLFGDSAPGLYHSSLPGTSVMDGSIFIRAAGITMKTMGWAHEGEEAKRWDRSVLGFDQAWSKEPRSSSYSHTSSYHTNSKSQFSPRSSIVDRKGKGKSDSILTTIEIQNEDEEILEASANDSSVLTLGGSNSRSVSRNGSRNGSEMGDDVRDDENLLSPNRNIERINNNGFNINGAVNNNSIEIRRRIESEAEEKEKRERKEREDIKEEERELMG